MTNDETAMLARISHRGRCIGPRHLRSSFCDKGLIDSGAGSDADRVYLRSARIRRVRWSSRGGGIRRRSGDVGCRALLRRETDRAIRLIERVAACFSDGRDPRAADTGRPADCCDRARLRGCQRPRRVTLRSGAGVVRRQPRGQAQGLCAAGGREPDEPAGTCPRRRMLPLSQDRLRSRGAAGRVRRRVPRCARQGAAGERARPRCHPLRGHQEGRFFHGYYDCYCYLPLYVFCGRQLLAAKLRRSNIDAAALAEDEMARLVARIRRRWPKVRILLRADSGFAREELMAWCEEQRVDYVFGLARNSRLVDEIAIDLAWAEAEHQETGKPARRFKDFFYATCDSWSRRRRVIGKAEHLAKGANPRFIVTSLKRRAIDARTLYQQVYCARGEMENRIKECQLELFADRTSTATSATVVLVVRLCAAI